MTLLDAPSLLDEILGWMRVACLGERKLVLFKQHGSNKHLHPASSCHLRCEDLPDSHISSPKLRKALLSRIPRAKAAFSRSSAVEEHSCSCLDSMDFVKDSMYNIFRHDPVAF